MEKKRGSEDTFSRVDYRSAVAWPKRIERERPFLLSVLQQIPDMSVLDLGCGTGEHCRFLATEGFEVVGLDRSEAMLSKAMEVASPANLVFVSGDVRSIRESIDRRFGGALCLGNTLANVTSSEDLESTFVSCNQILEKEGLFVFQILNYVRIRENGIRHLPLNFRQDAGREIIFLRLMDLQTDGTVRFCPTTMVYDPESDPPLQVRESKIINLHAWTLEKVKPLLEKAGFIVVGIYGDMTFGTYRPESSPDLVIVAKKV